MTNKIFLLVLIAALLSNCNSTSHKKAKEINYATLDSLRIKVGLKIGESKHFLPGNLQDLIVTKNNSILVSDWASVSITQFDENGKFVATVAKQGKGPGELSKYFNMKTIGDTLVTSSPIGKKTNYYAKKANGQFHFTHAVLEKNTTRRPLTIIGIQSDTTYYARAGKLITSIQAAVKNQKPYDNTTIVLVNKEGEIVKDSLALLKKGSNFMSQEGGGLRVEGVPYQYDDWFVPGENGSYMIARVDSSTFNFYNNRQQLQRTVSINVKSRPISDEDLDYGLKDASKQTRSKIAARVADDKPPFLNVWISKDHIWLKTTDNKDGQQIVVLDMKGNPVGKFIVPKEASIQTIRGNRVYTIYHGIKQGDSIRMYTVKT